MNKQLKTAKFGGSSVAGADSFRQVKEIIAADPSRKAVVVSAPGKRFSGDNKVTDLLYLCWAHIKYHVDHTQIRNMIKSRYDDIAQGLGLAFDTDTIFAQIEENLQKGASEAYLVSRGEYINGMLMAQWLGFDFVDAASCVFLNYDGSVDREKTYSALENVFAGCKNGMVLPGFYGSYPDGSTALMSRGGSDITGAILAAATNSDVYENWTDVPGILMADPGIVKNPRSIPRLTYAELRELSYMGAKVIHESSVFPVRDAGIPVNIRDTGSPAHPGTIIAESFDNEQDDAFSITGIAGRKGYSIIDVRLENMVQNLPSFRDILKCFEKRKIHIEQINSGVDAFTLIVQTEQFQQQRYALAAEIEEICGSGSVRVTEGICLIALVSRRMVFRPGISGLIFGTLGKANINIRMISQGAEELNIVIGVDSSDFEKAIRLLCDGFTQKD